jgi:hypothetical protein|tara:strand:+ start:4826 stop:5209 length:384 start_codon:yes stop_codon:yes gene_type:complete
MNLIIKQDCFDNKRIILKESKNCIKITYSLDYIYMIGLTIKLKDIKYIENDQFLFIEICDPKQYKFLMDINNFLSQKIEHYQSFLYNNKMKVKKHINFKSSEDNSVNITLNNLKKIKDNYKVQIFTI